jgi:hypothetical protein
MLVVLFLQIRKIHSYQAHVGRRPVTCDCEGHLFLDSRCFSNESIVPKLQLACWCSIAFFAMIDGVGDLHLCGRGWRMWVENLACASGRNGKDVRRITSLALPSFPMSALIATTCRDKIQKLTLEKSSEASHKLGEFFR